jgi:hypothetical protein
VKPYMIVALMWIAAAFAGLGLGRAEAPAWTTLVAALIITLAGSRWIQIVKKGVQ